MASAEEEVPSISLSISIDPSAHSFSSPTPPTVSVTATSHASRPLTVLTWHTLLHLDLALRQSAFRMTDLSTDQEVSQHSIQLSRAPIKRRIGSPDADLFLTLHPEQPVTISTPFGYSVDSNGPPRPEGDPGRLRQAARGMIPRTVCGIDGLVVGTEYELSVVGGLNVSWWRWGTKDEVLEPAGSVDASLGESEPAFEIDGEGIKPVRFSVAEY